MNFKVFLLFLLALILLSCATTKDGAVKIDLYHNNLFDILRHDIKVTVHPQRNLIFFEDNIVVDYENRKNKYSGALLLNDNMALHAVHVDGINQMVRTITSFSEEYFGKELSEEQLKYIADNSNVYEIEIQKHDKDTKEVTISIKYILEIDSNSEFFKVSNNRFKLDGNYFWYPSDFKYNSEINLTVITPQRFQVDVNGKTGKTGNINNLKSTTFHFDKVEKPLIIMGEG